MKKALIIYGSTTGNTALVANMIKDNITNYEVSILDATDAYADAVSDSDLVIYGSSTWGYGELQDDFQEYYDNEMTPELIKGKDFAVFGCGDHESFEDVFCNAVDTIEEKIKDYGGNLIIESLKIDGEPSDSEAQIIDFAHKL
ncbi:MAG: flavodoxin domain-containing protein [Eubacteriales bacterium]